MKLQIPRSEIKEALAGLSKVIPRKSTLPVLRCVHFTYDGTDVVASTTDLEQAVSYRLSRAVAEGVGEPVIVDIGQLKPLTTGKSKELIEMTPSRSGYVNLVNHVGDRAVTTEVTAMDPKEWPDVDTDVPTERVEASVLESIRCILPFTSTDPTRAVLGGIYLDVSRKGNHTMVATDGRRLTCCNNLQLPVKESCIIPSSKFLAWNKLTGEEMGVAKKGGIPWFRLKAGPWSYCSKVVEGTYPNWRQVLPDEGAAHTVEFAPDDVELLQTALPPLKGMKAGEVAFVCERGAVTLCTRDSEDSKWNTIELSKSVYRGTGTHIGVSRGYLLEALDKGFTSFTFEDALSPLRSSDGNGAIHVLMPCRMDKPELKATRGRKRRAQPTPAHQPKETSTMPKRKTTEPCEQQATLDVLAVAYRDAKEKVREVNGMLTQIGGMIKAARQEMKQQKSEVASARAALAKLQSIKL